MKNKSARFVLLLFGISFFILFILFTFVVKSKALDNFDLSTTVWIQNHLSKKFDTILSLFSLLGSFEVTFVILLVFLYFRKKLSGIMVALIFFFVHVLEIFGKAFLYHPGPPNIYFRYNLSFLFPSAYVKPGSSFPSGHSFRTIFVLLVAAFIISQAKKMSSEKKIVLNCLLITFVFLMLFSRISLGEHWFTDVLGGSLLGGSFGIFSLFFL